MLAACMNAVLQNSPAKGSLIYDIQMVKGGVENDSEHFTNLIVKEVNPILKCGHPYFFTH